jgi:CRP-like cAMP-binding protein
LSRSDNLRFVGPLERAAFLRTIGPLAAVDVADLAAFAENARESRYSAGDLILEHGSRVCAYHVVVEGRVRVEGGEHPTPVELGPRGAFGFLSMLCNAEEGIEARALEDTLVLTIEDDVFFDILEDNFAILVNLVRNLARVTLAERRRTPPDTYLAPAEGLLRKKPSDSIDLVERIALIRRPGSPFERASLEALARLARATPEIRFRAGETIWRTGDPTDHAIVLVAGEVECLAPDGRTMFRVGPGYPLGNLERFTDDPRWFTARAKTDVLGLRGDTEVFLDLLEDHFDMALDLVTTMARNVLRIRRDLAERGVALAPLPSDVQPLAPTPSDGG